MDGAILSLAYYESKEIDTINPNLLVQLREALVGVTLNKYVREN